MRLLMTTMTLIKKQNARTLALIGSTLIYLFIGAAVFDALESNFELEEADRLLKEETAFRDKYNISDDDFLLISKNVIKSAPHKAGTQWKFAGAIYFSTTVITTIGYGHSTPRTAGGKVFCMLYALVGIPLNLVMFQSIGERLNVFTTFILERFLRIVRRAFRSSHSSSSSSSSSAPDHIGTTQLIVVSMNVSTLVVAGGAWAFSNFENWSYLDSIYYCVITLTTVGFGDMVALQQDNVLQRRPDLVAFSVVFILVGLAVVSAAMNLLVLRFLTMNTVDERRDQQLRETLANMKQVMNSSSSCCEAATASEDVKVVVSGDPTSGMTSVVEGNVVSTGKTSSTGIGYRVSGNGYRVKRLRLFRSILNGKNTVEDDESDCWRLNWRKQKMPVETSQNAPSSALTTTMTMKRRSEHESAETLPCWRTGHHYKVTRPPSAIEHLLPMANNNSTPLRCTADSTDFPATLHPPGFHCSNEYRSSEPVTYRIYVEREFSGISSHTSASSLMTPKRISI